MNALARVAVGFCLIALIGGACVSTTYAQQNYSMSVVLQNGAGTAPWAGMDVVVFAGNPLFPYSGVTDANGIATFTFAIPQVGGRIFVYVPAVIGICTQYYFPLTIQKIGPDFVLTVDSGAGPGPGGTACYGLGMCGLVSENAVNDTFTLRTDHYAVPPPSGCEEGFGDN
jgi:hypothetical protein